MVSGWTVPVGGDVSKDGESHTRAKLASFLGCHVGLCVYRLKMPSLLTPVSNGCGRVSGGGVAIVIGEVERSSRSGGVGARGGTWARDMSPWGT
jgi:hypothetical protein